LHGVIQPVRASTIGLPLAKLRQVPPLLRAALKVRHITTCDQLLAAAARFENRAALAHAARIDPDRLTDLVRQADLERVKGVGWAFGLMLEALGIGDVATLAQQQPGRLHEQLRRYNQTHKLARRAPTAAEVAGWIKQARHLPELVTYPPQQREARR
jgi:predicted flap endonuclease-1-like 5' DNA nuclease